MKPSLLHRLVALVLVLGLAAEPAQTAVSGSAFRVSDSSGLSPTRNAKLETRNVAFEAQAVTEPLLEGFQPAGAPTTPESASLDRSAAHEAGYGAVAAAPAKVADHPLLPAEYEGDLKEAMVVDILPDGQYPVFELSAGHQIVQKYETLDLIRGGILDARAAYEMAHALGYDGIGPAQIYLRTPRKTSTIEEFVGIPLDRELDSAEIADLSQELDIRSPSHGDRYAAWARRFGDAFVEGDVYRMFSNHFKDSHEPRNMRLIRSHGALQLRWIDHDISFRPLEMLEPFVRRYLREHADMMRRHAPQLVTAITNSAVSDPAIERVAQNVYGRLAKEIIERKRIEDRLAVDAVEVQDALRIAEELKARFLTGAKARRDLFREVFAESAASRPLSELKRDLDGRLGPLLRETYREESDQLETEGDLVAVAELPRMPFSRRVIRRLTSKLALHQWNAQVRCHIGEPGQDHYFIRLEYQGRWWVLDPTWQCLIKRSDDNDRLPRALLLDESELSDGRLSYGFSLPAALMTVWRDAIEIPAVPVVRTALPKTSETNTLTIGPKPFAKTVSGLADPVILNPPYGLWVPADIPGFSHLREAIVWLIELEANARLRDPHFQTVVRWFPAGGGQEHGGIVEFTIHQNGLSEEDRNGLVVNKEGYDREGSAYFRNSAQRMKDGAAHRRGDAFKVLADLLDKTQVLLLYRTYPKMSSYLDTIAYIEIPPVVVQTSFEVPRFNRPSDHSVFLEQMQSGTVHQSRYPKDPDLLQKLGIKTGERVYGFAGFLGDWLRPLHEQGAEVTYTDAHPEIVRRISRRQDRALADGRVTRRMNVRVSDALREPQEPDIWDWGFSFEPIPLDDLMPWVLLRSLLNRRGFIGIYRQEAVLPDFKKRLEDFAEVYGLDVQNVSGDASSLPIPESTFQFRNVSIHVLRGTMSPSLPAHIERFSVWTVRTSETLRRQALIDLTLAGIAETKSPWPSDELQQELQRRGLTVSHSEILESLQRLSALSGLLPESCRVPVILVHSKEAVRRGAPTAAPDQPHLHPGTGGAA